MEQENNIIPFKAPSHAGKVRCWEVGPYGSADHDSLVFRGDVEALGAAQQLLEDRWDSSAAIWVENNTALDKREFSVYMKEVWYTEEELLDLQDNE